MNLDKIYTRTAPKHYVLQWNSMKPLIFNCKMSMFRSPRQTQRQKTLTKLTVASDLWGKTFSLFWSLTTCFCFFLFICTLLTLLWKALRCLPLSMHSSLHTTIYLPNAEEYCGCRRHPPPGSKLAHETVVQLSQGQLQRQWRSCLRRGYIAMSPTPTGLAGSSLVFFIFSGDQSI